MSAVSFCGSIYMVIHPPNIYNPHNFVIIFIFITDTGVDDDDIGYIGDDN